MSVKAHIIDWFKKRKAEKAKEQDENRIYLPIPVPVRKPDAK